MPITEEQLWGETKAMTREDALAECRRRGIHWVEEGKPMGSVVLGKYLPGGGEEWVGFGASYEAAFADADFRLAERKEAAGE